MAYNGSGTFLINTAGQPVVSGTVISSTAFNALTADLATGLSTAITKDGQTTVTANIPMSTYKFTGLGVGSAATDSANLSQVQSTVTKLLNSVSGADTITATASPTLAAYAAGQMFYFVAAGDNTTSVTLNIDSLGAKAVTRDGATALAAADIKSGEVVVVVYDGTRFQVVSQLNSAGDARFANVSIASSLYVGGVSTFVGNAGFSANVSIASALSVGGVAAITGATTIGGNLTLSGGTANGVLYLNGSKVATSGSALTFDGTNFATTGNSRASGQFLAGSTGAATPDFSFIADNTLGIFRAPNALGFSIAGSEQMRLTSTGLGIGTASPQFRLDVQTAGGRVQLRDGASTGGTSSGNGIASVNTALSAVVDMNYRAAVHAFISNNTETMRLDSSGNLGIGTASPSGRLHISTASGNTDFYHNVTGAGTAARTVYTRGGTVQFYAGLGAWSGTDTYQIAGASGPLTTLDSSGNLGIGTASPAYRLDVRGTSTDLFQVKSTGAYTFSRFQSSSRNWALSIGSNFEIYDETAAATRIVVDPSGNLGIGTASPTEALEISRTTDPKIRFVDVGNLDAKIGIVGSTALGFEVSGSERARITSDGNLSLGATSASYRIQSSVASGADRDMFLSGVSGVTNGLQVNYIHSGTALSVKFNNITTTASAANAFLDSGDGNRIYRSTSSIRYKKDIEDINHEFADAALNLRPVWYRSKADSDNKDWSWYGLIAEEVAEVEPRLVHWAYPEDAFDVETVDGSIKKTVKEGAKQVPDGVQYERLSVLLLDIVKRQNARIESLEAKVAALEAK